MIPAGGWRKVVRWAAYGVAARVRPDDRFVQRRLRVLRPRRLGERTALRAVAIGTTGLCNASCIHCPTGKAITAHVPRTPMDMALFRGIVDTIFDQGWSVGSMHFGLFGDGLVDPSIVERCRYARERLPDIMLDVNTNGAAFDPGRHAALADHVSLVTLHCESIRADTYDRLMAPLRLKNVFPKYAPFFDAFPGKVRVSIPVSRLNLGELDDLRGHFLAQGAREVVFDPLGSRCTEDQTLFRQLALAPVEIRCTPDIMDDLIVDCDGMVLACCQDFERRTPIGDVSAGGLVAALADPRRDAFRRMLDEGRHHAAPTCSRCNGDARTPDFPFDILSTMPAVQRQNDVAGA
ncbi:radical SAM/SPASM domain-containing protein [Sphingomonas nostoxanthinifaciens]|uniref:radical SAM/SPASM domain-containing protein n=1 Tax=Sphingomonas nostoxanthinifaciens TaxID=2872652 RepID=UPI001CC1CC82|nr:radical SAM/SPASM domain-containing protein [Sphingomonas nostoxanthinifaciens]UAK24675.1 SPASM domain-containing protein [Sphingomonas nostoxanthinifaciens]